MTLSGQTGRTAQTPTDRHPPSFPPSAPISCYPSPPPLPEVPLPLSKCTQQVAPAGPPRPHLCPPLHLRRSPPAEPWAKPTFEVLGVAPRRAIRVSSLQRGDTGEVVTHGIGTPGVLQRGAGKVGQEPRKGVQVCARASARLRGRALAGLRPGAGGSLSPALPGLGGLLSAGPARCGDPCATRLSGSHAPRPGRPGPWAPARGARRCTLPGSGARVPAAGGRRSGGALPAGHRVGARRASAQRLGGGLGPRPRGRPWRRAWRPPARG